MMYCGLNEAFNIKDNNVETHIKQENNEVNEARQNMEKEVDTIHNTFSLPYINAFGDIEHFGGTNIEQLKIDEKKKEKKRNHQYYIDKYLLMIDDEIPMDPYVIKHVRRCKICTKKIRNILFKQQQPKFDHQKIIIYVLLFILIIDLFKKKD